MVLVIFLVTHSRQSEENKSRVRPLVPCFRIGYRIRKNLRAREEKVIGVEPLSGLGIVIWFPDHSFRCGVPFKEGFPFFIPLVQHLPSFGNAGHASYFHVRCRLLCVSDVKRFQKEWFPQCFRSWKNLNLFHTLFVNNHEDLGVHSPFGGVTSFNCLWCRYSFFNE